MKNLFQKKFLPFYLLLGGIFVFAFAFFYASKLPNQETGGEDESQKLDGPEVSNDNMRETTETPQVTMTLTPTVRPTSRITPTVTKALTATLTPTLTVTPTPTAGETVTPTITPTLTPTLTPTETPTGTFTPTPS